MKRILFVCTGNICRSPTAEGIARALIQMLGLQGEIEVDSAGTHAGMHAGEAPDPRSLRVAAKRGHDFSKLRARKVMPQDFEQFDLILGMDAGHTAWLERCCPPEHLGKIQAFMQPVPHTGFSEVPDPYFGGEEGFEQVFELCEEAVEAWLRKITDPS